MCVVAGRVEQGLGGLARLEMEQFWYLVLNHV